MLDEVTDADYHVGVPAFFAHLPVLGGLLRRVSLNTIQRLVEDLLNIVNKVCVSMWFGRVQHIVMYHTYVLLTWPPCARRVMQQESALGIIT